MGKLERGDRIQPGKFLHPRPSTTELGLLFTLAGARALASVRHGGAGFLEAARIRVKSGDEQRWSWSGGHLTCSPNSTHN
jgi:hypothetical protein